MKKLFLLLGIVLIFAIKSCGPSIHLVEGDPSTIKGEEFVEVQFTYDNMRVGNEPEEDYVARRIESDGEEWHEAWVNNRESRFEPRFIETLNRYTEPQGLIFEKNRTDTRYIMKVNTYYTEPGFYVAVRNAPAKVGLTISFVDRDQPDNTLVKFDIPEVEGIVTPDVGTRIHSAYSMGGRLLGSELAGHIR